MYKRNSIILFLLLTLIINPAYSTPKKSAKLRTENRKAKTDSARIKNIDKMISKFESGFLKFTNYVKKMFKKHGDRFNAKTLQALDEVLDFFINNMKNNKIKNHAKYVLKRKAGGGKPPFYRFNNNALFRYDILPKVYRSSAVSAFNMRKRVLYINPTYSPESKFDNIVAFHELVHALQDTTLRKHLKKMGAKGKKYLKQYLATLHPKSLKDPDLEPVAFAMEIELMNFLLNDGIRKLVKTGSLIQSLEIAKILKVNTRYKLSALRFVKEYSLAYFHHNCNIYSYTRFYRALILYDYMKMGYKFYKSDNKFIKPTPKISRRFKRNMPRHRRPPRYRKRHPNRVPYRQFNTPPAYRRRQNNNQNRRLRREGNNNYSNNQNYRNANPQNNGNSGQSNNSGNNLKDKAGNIDIN